MIKKKDNKIKKKRIEKLKDIKNKIKKKQKAIISKDDMDKFEEKELKKEKNLKKKLV